MSEHSDTREPKPLRRSRSDRMLAGVCGGLAAHLDVHPSIFRVAFVVLTLLGGAGILIYLAATVVMPAEGDDDSIATAALRARRDRPLRLIALGVIAVVGAIVLSEVSLWPRGDAWPFLLVAGALTLWITRALVAHEGVTDASTAAATGSRRKRRLGLVGASIVVFLLTLAALFVAAFDVELHNGIGERTYTAAGGRDLRREYRLGIGDLHVDLRSARLPVGQTHVQARVDVGAVRVTVPEDIALRVRAAAHLGELDLLGKRVGGGGVEAQLEQTGDRVLVLDVHVGLGSASITRAAR